MTTLSSLIEHFFQLDEDFIQLDDHFIQFDEDFIHQDEDFTQHDKDTEIQVAFLQILLSRFDPALSEKRSTLYWIRSNRRNHDTAAIGETAFDQDYR